MSVVAAVLAGLAALTAVPVRSRDAAGGTGSRPAGARSPGAAAVLAGALVGGAALSATVGGVPGLVCGAALVVAVVRRVAGADGRTRRRAAARAASELPHLVLLLATTLRGGASAAAGLAAAAAALPGPAADRVAPACHRLAVGVDPAEVWAGLADDPALGPLGRALGRAHASGASVVEAVDRLAEDLASEARARVEERARTVGVRAAVPLGLCLLPSFLLLGIVPLAAGLLGQVAS